MFLKLIPLLVFLLTASAPPAYSDGDKSRVMVITLNSVINPVAAEYISRSINEAAANNLEALVIELDTPGGLDASMRGIVKDIMSSQVPVVVYVSPAGARAASAGVFITLAAHIAAMAPGTNIGAAHPVSISGKMDKTTDAKVTNDAAAYIRTIAEKNGRNAKWAEDAVRRSISSTENYALRDRIIDLVSKDLNALVSDIDGRKVQTISGLRVLKTKSAVIEREDPGLRHKVLGFISDPNVAYILMLLGFYGIFFELTNPGSIFPGVTGVICLILAFYSFQTLPVNYAGLLLIILAIILFILEVKIVSHGLLTVGGVISMLIGSLMLFESPEPFMRLSLYLVLPAVIVTALFFSLTIGLAFKAYKKRPVTGPEGLIKAQGRADTDVTADSGTVSIHGEIWSAYAGEFIPKGAKITVEEVSGLKLKVRRL